MTRIYDDYRDPTGVPAEGSIKIKASTPVVHDSASRAVVTSWELIYELDAVGHFTSEELIPSNDPSWGSIGSVPYLVRIDVTGYYLDWTRVFVPDSATPVRLSDLINMGEPPPAMPVPMPGPEGRAGPTGPPGEPGPPGADGTTVQGAMDDLTDVDASGILDGQTLVFQGGVYVPGTAGGGGGDTGFYTHTQAMPSTDWVVAHNMGRIPAVQAFDAANSMIVGSVRHDNTNQLTVHFYMPITGKAYCA